MITETAGNLFEAKAGALVNFNYVGIMGKGIALQFKQKFPVDYFNAYKIACQKPSELAIGKVQVYELKNAQTNPRYIINFPTKRHWRELCLPIGEFVFKSQSPKHVGLTNVSIFLTIFIRNG